MTYNKGDWRIVTRKGAFETLSWLEKEGEARFNEMYKGSEAGCIATFAAVLKTLEANNLVEKKYYVTSASNDTFQPLNGAPGVGESIIVKYAITQNGRDILKKIREIQGLMNLKS